MESDDKHKWKEIEKQYGFSHVYVCTRGDCGCKKFVSSYKGVNFLQYERAGLILRERPDCYGDIPISQQKTDAKVISITKQIKEDRSDIYKKILNRKME